VNVAGTRLRDLEPEIGTPDDMENWEQVHVDVINRCVVFYFSTELFCEQLEVDRICIQIPLDLGFGGSGSDPKMLNFFGSSWILTRIRPNSFITRDSRNCYSVS